jgi:hypothetical protein
MGVWVWSVLKIAIPLHDRLLNIHQFLSEVVESRMYLGIDRKLKARVSAELSVVDLT